MIFLIEQHNYAKFTDDTSLVSKVYDTDISTKELNSDLKKK